MKVLLVGGAAREHAMAEAVRRAGAELVAVLPNRNPGILRLSSKVKHAEGTDVDAVASFANQERVDLLIVGPEAPLAAGVTDEVAKLGVKVASPSKAAARVETSKSFMRELMVRRKVHGAIEADSFSSSSDARLHIMACDYPVVIKPSGLTGGKGVKVEGKDLKSKEEAAAYADEVLSRRIGGEATVVVERRLDGEEFTLQAFCDGSVVRSMPVVQDHKRAFEGDKGPNTGGMGSYSLADHGLPFLAPEETNEARTIMAQAARALAAEGCPFVGVLYGQFMATVEGPRVIEFNARFGDPEAMNVLPLLETNYVDVCQAMAEGRLGDMHVKFAKKATVCKYVVPKGYGTPEVSKGALLKVDEAAVEGAGARPYFAAVEAQDGGLRMSSSRALGLVGISDKVVEAERIVEEALKAVQGEYRVRHDIGTQELIRKKIERMKGAKFKAARHAEQA